MIRRPSADRRRRASRPAAVLVVLALTAAACSGGGDASEAEDRPVTVLGTWTADQEKAFEALLEKSNVDYVYQGTAAQREVLLSQVKSGNPPDIAVMASPGELADYVREGELQSLDGLYEPSEYGEPWQPRVSGRQQNYMVPLKADLKSIAWYRKDEPPGDRPPPADAWCIGMGDDGASGWPGTDWIEDILLQQSDGTETYEEWAGGVRDWTSKPIADAWRTWGAMLAQDRTPKGKYPAAERALSNDHRGEPHSSGLLFGGGKESRGKNPRGGEQAPACSLEHQGSFARTFYRKHAADARFVPSSGLLPGGPYGRQQRHEVSADFAAMFTSTPASRKLLAYLASSGVQQSWVRMNKPPVYSFSANSGVEDHSFDDDTSERVAARLTDQDSVRCLDASDTMPPAVRDAFYEATLRFLTRPARDPRDLLEDIQKVQEVERRKLKLGDDEKWMTDICG